MKVLVTDTKLSFKLQRNKVPDRYHPFNSIEFTIGLKESKDYAMAAVIHREKVKASTAKKSLVVGAVNIIEVFASNEILSADQIAEAWHPLVMKLEKFVDLTSRISEVSYVYHSLVRFMSLIDTYGGFRCSFIHLQRSRSPRSLGFFTYVL